MGLRKRGVRAIRISGNSMSPALNSGDWVLFRTIRPDSAPAQVRDLQGKVVLIQRRAFGFLTADDSQQLEQSDFLQVKRVQRISEEGIWVEGDNEGESTDSRQWGYLKPVEVVGILILRYKRTAH